jgi:hypothetical protein
MYISITSSLYFPRDEPSLAGVQIVILQLFFDRTVFVLIMNTINELATNFITANTSNVYSCVYKEIIMSLRIVNKILYYLIGQGCV